MQWWRNMDLTPWTGEGKVLASVPTDPGFAQAIAAERARTRGARQRITVEHPPHHSRPVLFVQDAPEPVAEPCS